MGQPPAKHVDIADYLVIERTDRTRYEYHTGEIFAMAGGSINHSRICNNISGELREAVKKKGICESFNSEMKIEVAQGSRYVYPDAGVACPELKESRVITGAIVNPRLVIEVISQDSEGYDRGLKWRYYSSISTVREYVIIAQDEPWVMIHRREDPSDYLKLESSVEGLDGSINLVSINATISLNEIYRNVVFPETKPDVALKPTP